jgi:hypothetical protein
MFTPVTQSYTLVFSAVTWGEQVPTSQQPVEPSIDTNGNMRPARPTIW